MSRQSQRFVKEAAYPLSFRHAFSAAVTPSNNNAGGGAFPAVGTKIALSAAQSSKVMQPGLSTLSAAAALVLGDVSLDDTNDRILLEPGIYRVQVSLLLLGATVASDFHVGLSTAAAAVVDVEYEAVLGGANLAAGANAHFSTVQYLSVTAARALELHVAWSAATATGTIRPGSVIEVRRLGNLE